jgi:hypothetical protein
MDNVKEESTNKNKWTTPMLLILNTRRTQSGDSVNKDNEDGTYTFPQLS